MKKRIRLLLLSILLLINGCSSITEPPALQEMEKVFHEYREEFQIITAFVLTQEGFDSIYSGQDLKSAPENIQKADGVLRKQAGCNSIHRSGNTVTFILWTRFTDAGCGIAYTTESSPEPDMTFLTQIEPLSEDGWYYYVEDYSEWRAERSL